MYAYQWESGPCSEYITETIKLRAVPENSISVRGLEIIGSAKLLFYCIGKKCFSSCNINSLIVCVINCAGLKFDAHTAVKMSIVVLWFLKLCGSCRLKLLDEYVASA
jgi:hypothetical protein